MMKPSEQQHQGEARPTGLLANRVLRDLGDLRAPAVSKATLTWRLSNWWKHRTRDLHREAAYAFVGRLSGVITMRSVLSGQVYRMPVDRLHLEQIVRIKQLLSEGFPVWELPRFFGGELVNYGVLSTRVVTTAGVNAIVDAFQNTFEVENFKFHGYGTGVNAEATGNTALQTELTTEYSPDNTRPTGSQGEGASANVYRTTATLSPDSGGTLAITEHGIFSATTAGTLLDRSVFSAINIVAGQDSLQTQYDFTCTAGG